MKTNTTTQIKDGMKVTVRTASGDFFARIIRIAGNEALVREYGTRREEYFPLSAIVAR